MWLPPIASYIPVGANTLSKHEFSAFSTSILTHSVVIYHLLYSFCWHNVLLPIYTSGGTSVLDEDPTYMCTTGYGLDPTTHDMQSVESDYFFSLSLVSHMSFT